MFCSLPLSQGIKNKSVSIRVTPEALSAHRGLPRVEVWEQGPRNEDHSAASVSTAGPVMGQSGSSQSGAEVAEFCSWGSSSPSPVPSWLRCLSFPLFQKSFVSPQRSCKATRVHILVCDPLRCPPQRTKCKALVTSGRAAGSCSVSPCDLAVCHGLVFALASSRVPTKLGENLSSSF